MTKPEEHRNRWALGLTITFFVLIFVSFAFYKGYLGFGKDNIIATQQKSGNQVANIASAESVPSPLQNTKETFIAAFEEIDKKYQEFKDSMSAVFVPFITGIEVYERK